MPKVHIFLAFIALGALHGVLAQDAATASQNWNTFTVTPEQIAVAKAALVKDEQIPTAKIAYGTPAIADQFPWIVSLQNVDPYSGTLMHICAGTLIAPNLVVTAGHCIFNEANELELPAMVYLGALDLSGPSDAKEKIAVTEAYTPKGYDNTEWNYEAAPYDMAILRLESDSTLPVAPLATEEPNFGDQVTAAGWGATEAFYQSGTSPTELLWTTMTVSTGSYPCPPVGPGVICTAGQPYGNGYTSTCQGDSGGPHLANDKLIGVTSFGPGAPEDCGLNTYQGITSIAYYYQDFIAPVIQQYGSGAAAGTPVVTDPVPAPTPVPEPITDYTPTPVPVTDPTIDTTGSNDLLSLLNDLFGGNLFDDYNDVSSYSAATENPSAVAVLNCARYRSNSLSRKKYIGGTKVRTTFKSISRSACANECLAQVDCLSFNYNHRTKGCSLFAQTDNELQLVKDPKYSAGFLSCSSPLARSQESTTQQQEPSFSKLI